VRPQEPNWQVRERRRGGVVQARAWWCREVAWDGLPTAVPSAAGAGREE
jgi:hypothetical protein